MTIFDHHDPWVFLIAGGLFLLAANRCGRELAEGLQESDDPPEHLVFQIRWNVLVWRAFGGLLITYATVLAVLS
jgi:hypothetical protein